MSRKDTYSKDTDEPQRRVDSRSNQLTAANLAAHEAATSAVSPNGQHTENHNMQRWLVYNGDRQLPTRDAQAPRDWSRLVEMDELAAAIEGATRGEGAVRKRDT